MSSPTEHVTELHAEVSGKGDPVALLHGFTQTGRSWRHVAATLAGDYEVICVDLPGHGRSADCLAGDLPEAARLVAQRAGRASYVGYSLGGRIALQLALDHPHLVERLVLVGATPGIREQSPRDERRRADEALAELIDPTQASGGDAMSVGEFLHNWLANPMFADLSATQRDESTRRENSAQGLACALRCLGVGTQAPLHDRLGELAMAVLCLAGEADAKFVPIAKEMATLIGPNATAAVVKGALHSAPFSQPERFVAILRAFLQTTTS